MKLFCYLGPSAALVVAEAGGRPVAERQDCGSQLCDYTA